jgi:hypothetical protein
MPGDVAVAGRALRGAVVSARTVTRPAPSSPTRRARFFAQHWILIGVPTSRFTLLTPERLPDPVERNDLVVAARLILKKALAPLLWSALSCAQCTDGGALTAKSYQDSLANNLLLNALRFLSRAFRVFGCLSGLSAPFREPA